MLPTGTQANISETQFGDFSREIKILNVHKLLKYNDLRKIYTPKSDVNLRKRLSSPQNDHFWVTLSPFPSLSKQSLPH